MPGPRVSRERARTMSARVWPLSRCASTASLSDSTAETMKRQPSAASSGRMRAVAQQVLDLGRDVEGQRGELGVQRARDREGVVGPVEEVGVAERDVGRPRRHLLADVREDHSRGTDEEAAAVDGRDRAVAAEVEAAPARLDVADQLVPAVALELRVLLEGGQRARLGPGSRGAQMRRGGLRPAVLTAGGGARRRAPARPPARPAGPPPRRRSRCRRRGREVIGVERRVEAVEAEVARGVHRAHPLGDRRRGAGRCASAPRRRPAGARDPLGRRTAPPRGPSAPAVARAPRKAAGEATASG